MRQHPDEQPEVNQPGLRALREAVANYLARQRQHRASLRQDGIAGLNSALSSVPDGMAAGLLAGVNPVYGLYACTLGPIAGGVVSSTQLMVVTTTSASALAARQALVGLPIETRDNALFVMVILIGVFQVIFGLLKLGRLTGFVSFSVMTGFIAGIAVLTVLTQLPTVTGYQPMGDSRITQTVDLLLHTGEIQLPTLAVAALALALAVILPRTRLGNLGTLVAIAAPSLAVALFGIESVRTVRDVGGIPSGIPTLSLPSTADLTVNLLTGALAVAIIIVVQGAGVSQSVPNPDETRRSTSRDFVAQGAANVASGFFRGLPVGGSLGTTALNVVSGARTRWAAIFAGLWMAAIVAIFPGLVSYIAMPALGALLMVASARTIKLIEMTSIWNAGWTSRLAIVTTFLATLFLPIQVAVGIGTVLSALLHLYQESTDVSVVELVRRSDGRIEEHRPPKRLPSNEVTVLDVYGHLFYAGARTLERSLPTPRGAENPVVILRLRGRTVIGATLVHVLSGYSASLRRAHGRLYLSGITDEAHDQLIRNGELHLSGPVRAYEATPIVWQSTQRAYAAARTWLVEAADDARPDEASSGRASRE